MANKETPSEAENKTTSGENKQPVEPVQEKDYLVRIINGNDYAETIYLNGVATLISPRQNDMIVHRSEITKELPKNIRDIKI